MPKKCVLIVYPSSLLSEFSLSLWERVGVRVPSVSLKPLTLTRSRGERENRSSQHALEELHLVKVPADDGRWIHAQPVLQDGGVNRAEVQVEFQVATLFLLAPLQGGVDAVDAALHLLANCEGHTGRAVVGAGAVVSDAAAKLGEHEQQHVVAGLVGPQVVEERLDGVRHIQPELGMIHCLGGMSVEAVVWGRGIQDPRAEVG